MALDIKSVSKTRLTSIKQKHAAEKAQQLSALPEMVSNAIQCHEQWVKSQGKDGAKMDLRNHVLTNIELTHFELDEAELRNANLSEANIICGSLDKACLSGCKIDGAYFYASLKKANLQKVHGENVSFNADDCCEAGFSNAILPKSDFTYAKLKKASFDGADLTEAKFEGADLESANFFNANLKNANFIGVQTLEGANFYGADISGAKISLNDITIEQLGQCLYTPELAQMIQAKYCLMKA